MIFYAYLGYPVVLWFISLFKHGGNKYLEKPPGQSGQYQPRVSLLISAYNEENVIEDKILNSLALNYPKDLLEIVVISDGSEDKTNQIVAGYAEKDVILRNYGRIGKTACLNKAVPLVEGDIIIFSDANTKYDRDAVRELVKHFSDAKIGFVTGHTKYFSERGSEDLHSIGAYSNIERITKKFESKIGSCVGADGAIFAIRKDLYQPLNDFDINDFVIPLNIIKQGFRGILEEKAFCIEKTAKELAEEFNRQARITNRTIRALFNNADMLNPFKYGIFSFELLSHKIFKFLMPFFMLALLLTNVIMIIHGTLYVLTLTGQLFLYFLAWMGYIGKYSKRLSRLVSASETFTIVNLAFLCGWIKYFKGETYTTWTSAR